MANVWTPLGYRGKTWIYTAQAIIFGGLGGFAGIMGPLFLSGILRPAHGRPGTQAGIALSIMSVPFLLLFAGAFNQRLAYGQLILRCYREGIEFDLIGDTGRRIPLVPRLFSILWSHVSGRAFQRSTVRLNWSNLQDITIIGMPMARELFIRGEWQSPRKSTTASAKMPNVEFEEIAYGPEFAIPEVTFARSLSDIATEIETVANNEQLQQSLPSWFAQ
jgi:hypothetical protein